LNVPRGGSYLPQLDGVRAIAVVMVLLLHIVPPDGGGIAWLLRNGFSYGWIGVDIFFVLSGYLITAILLKEKGEPHYFRNFYARRALRIFPLFYLVAIVLLVAAPHLPFGPFPALPILTYTSNFTMVFTHREWPPLAHCWSLCVEEQFYLFYPFLVLRLNVRQLRAMLWWVIALSPFVRLATNALLYPAAATFLTFGYFDLLGMGALIAVEFHERTTIGATEVRRLQGAFVMTIGLTLLLIVTKQLDVTKAFGGAFGLTVVGAASALFIVLVALDALPFGGILRLRPAVMIGRISYGIYLLHYPIAKLSEPFLGTRAGWTRTSLAAAVEIGGTLPLAMLSWVAFEQPILRLKRYFYERTEAA